jgi:hypothetical protein
MCSALVTPAEAALGCELPPVGEELVELLDELHAARATDAAITVASDRAPGTLIAHASKPKGSRHPRERLISTLLRLTGGEG